MVKATGTRILANGVKVHRLKAIVREGLEFIDFDLSMVYLTMLPLELKYKINCKLKTGLGRSSHDIIWSIFPTCDCRETHQYINLWRKYEVGHEANEK
jgi:hypothetical protein